MKLTVRLFARAKELAGTPTAELYCAEHARVADVRQELGQKFPQLQPILPYLMIAVDSEYASDDYELAEANEVACFPPVSGG